MSRIRSVRWRDVAVTPKTVWTFVAVGTDDGRSGFGEATLNQGPHPGPGIERIGASIVGAPADPSALDRIGRPSTLVEGSARSAVDMALWDLASAAGARPLALALAADARREVPVYANVNRRTLDRSPAGFALSAAEAVAATHRAIKIAPFDEVTPGLTGPAAIRAAAAGLERVDAVRDAIGPRVALMVDCHWRLDVPTAEAVIDHAGRAGLHWVECPLPEGPGTVTDLRRLRARANAVGVLLAGLETQVGVEGFAPYLEGGCYDVIMPDVKYVGGLAEFLRVAERAHASGVSVSPHNPTGPVCHMASLHVAAAVPGLWRLERQFDETPMFDGLVGGAVPPETDGVARWPEDRPGLGVDLAFAS